MSGEENAQCAHLINCQERVQRALRALRVLREMRRTHTQSLRTVSKGIRNKEFRNGGRGKTLALSLSHTGSQVRNMGPANWTRSKEKPQEGDQEEELSCLSRVVVSFVVQQSPTRAERRKKLGGSSFNLLL